MSKNYCSIPMAAAELNVSIATLARWRQAKRGPAYVKLGPRKIVYLLEDIERFVAESKRAA